MHSSLKIPFKLWAAVIALSICFSFLSVFAFDNAETLSENDIISESAVLMDASTGQILYNKNAGEKMYPASITKIMTAVVALENADSDGTVTAVQEALDDVDYSSTHIALNYGEEAPFKDMLYAMMMMSANDAADCLAVYTAGSLDKFSDMMNLKAEQIGAKNTHFVNAHGMPDEEHYTTAEDMALITKYAIGVDGFADAFGKVYYEMPPTNVQTEQRNFYSQSMMLNNTVYYDERVIGAKLGWTEESGHTMVTVAEKSGRELICVVMNSSKYDKYKDTKKLLDYGFSQFVPVTLTENDLTSKDIPIDISGTTIGYTAAHTDETTLLLHKNVDKNTLKVQFSVPDTITELPDEGQTYSVTVSADNKAVPTFSGVLYTGESVLEIDREIADKIMDLQNSANLFRGFESSNIKIWIKICALAFVACFIIILAAVRFKGKKRIAD